MMWLLEDATGLGEAVARAHSQGKTPLLLDAASTMFAENHYAKRREALVLDLKHILNDERSGAKTHKVALDEARAKLVEAMRKGKVLYVKASVPRLECGPSPLSYSDTPLTLISATHAAILSRGAISLLNPTSILAVPQLDDKAADLIAWCDKESFPLAALDHRVVAALEPYLGGEGAKPHDEKVWDKELCCYHDWHGLWQSDHPLAKVLRHTDLHRGSFDVMPGFEVVVACTHAPGDYKHALGTCMPMGRLQAIQPSPTPGA